MKVAGLLLTCIGAVFTITAWVQVSRNLIFVAIGAVIFVIGAVLLVWKGSVEKA